MASWRNPEILLPLSASSLIISRLGQSSLGPGYKSSEEATRLQVEVSAAEERSGDTSMALSQPLHLESAAVLGLIQVLFTATARGAEEAPAFGAIQCILEPVFDLFS